MLNIDAENENKVRQGLNGAKKVSATTGQCSQENSGLKHHW